VLLGWVRAILLQFAHPLIAAGVADHSSFRGGMGAAISRLHHTVGAMLALTFGGDDDRERALEAIRTIHRRVHGSLSESCGRFPAGTPYSAEDPALLLWVHATLIDSILRVYDRLIAPLSDTDRDAYCVDATEVAIALGAHAQDVPQSWRSLQAYLDAQYASGVIEPCTQARVLAAALLAPSSLTIMVPLTAIGQLVGAGMLPGQLRRAYGFEWSRWRERSFRVVMAMLRMARRVAPPFIAWWPEARRRASAGHDSD
jgi:uncharacterized protein (DUF2236 family)